MYKRMYTETVLNILSIRSLLAARLGFDITDYHVISCFELDKFFIRAAKRGNLNEIEYLIFRDSVATDTKTLNKALTISATNGHFDVVRYLVSCGANIHTSRDNALRWSVIYGYLNIVQYLISQGANKRVVDCHTLHLATLRGHSDVVEYMVSQGAKSKMIKTYEGARHPL